MGVDLVASLLKLQLGEPDNIGVVFDQHDLFCVHSSSLEPRFPDQSSDRVKTSVLRQGRKQVKAR